MLCLSRLAAFILSFPLAVTASSRFAVRPAIVVQPLPAKDITEAYPGEVHARHEPELAFRIGGKVSKRLVETGERVKKDQPLAELDPEDVRLQLEATRARRWLPPKPTCRPSARNTLATRRCWSANWSASRSSTTSRMPTVPARRG